MASLYEDGPQEILRYVSYDMVTTLKQSNQCTAIKNDQYIELP